MAGEGWQVAGPWAAVTPVRDAQLPQVRTQISTASVRRRHAQCRWPAHSSDGGARDIESSDSVDKPPLAFNLRAIEPVPPRKGA